MDRHTDREEEQRLVSESQVGLDTELTHYMHSDRHGLVCLPLGQQLLARGWRLPARHLKKTNFI